MKNLTISEAIKYSGKSENTIRGWIRRGKLKDIKQDDGGRYVISKKELDTLLSKKGLKETIKGYIVAIVNHKGGVGKTTTIFNLGVFLAQKGFTSLLIDNDPQGNLTSHVLGEHIDHTSKVYKEQKILQELIVPTKYKFDLIPTYLELSNTELELQGVLRREEILNSALQRSHDILKKYHFVLVDNPPTLGMLTVNAMFACHSFLIVAEARTLNTTALEGIFSVRDIIPKPPKFLGFIINKYNSRTKESQNAVNILTDLYGDKLFKTKIPDTTTISLQDDRKSPLLHKRHDYKKDLTGIGNEFLDKISQLKFEDLQK